MAEQRKNPAVWAIVALAAGTIIAGLAVTGGPMQGRAERRDQTRMSDIAAMSRQAHCLANAESRVDGDLSATALCPDAPRMQDPFSDAPYQVEVLDPRHLRLCAAFEQERERYPGLGEWQDGCVVIELRAGNSED